MKILRIGRFLIIILVMLGGCSGSALLPRSSKDVKADGEGFYAIKGRFDKIIPYVTTVDMLRELGFDPMATSNMKLMTYPEIMEKFMPNPSISLETLDQELQDCFAAKKLCHAYGFRLESIQKKRYGNVLLDLFDFKRNTHITGWRFQGVIVIKDDTVVYKIWGGMPVINEKSDRVNPLGPLQSPRDVVLDNLSVF